MNFQKMILWIGFVITFGNKSSFYEVSEDVSILSTYYRSEQVCGCVIT